MTQARKKQRRVGRRRWAELTRFLIHTMKTSGSERVRMAAATHLKDVLVLREQRELIELRAATRQAETGNVPALETPELPEPVRTQADALREAQEFLARTNQGVTIDANEQ
jgi:hypothetical protein